MTCASNCRANSLRHLQLHSLREDYCSSFWYWEVVLCSHTLVPTLLPMFYPSLEVHNNLLSSDLVERSKYLILFYYYIVVKLEIIFNWMYNFNSISSLFFLNLVEEFSPLLMTNEVMINNLTSDLAKSLQRQLVYADESRTIVCFKPKCIH